MGSKHRGPFQPPRNITQLSAPHPHVRSHGGVQSSPSKRERADTRDRKSPSEFFPGTGTPHPIAPYFLTGSVEYKHGLTSSVIIKELARVPFHLSGWQLAGSLWEALTSLLKGPKWSPNHIFLP